MREIIAEQGDFKLFDLKMEDKMKYKNLFKTLNKTAIKVLPSEN